MQTGPFMKGLSDADGRFQKFQRSLVGKAATATVGLTSLTRGFDALAESFEKSVYEGENFTASLQQSTTEFLKSIPVAGAFARIAVAVRDKVLGDADALRVMNERLASVSARMGLTTAEANRLKVSMDALSDAQNAVNNFGKSAVLIRMQEAGATFAAQQRVVELASALERLNQAQANESARFAMIRSLEEQAGMWGTNAREIDLYKAAALGAKQVDIDWINTLHDRIDAMKALEEATKRQNDLMAEGARITDSVRTAQEIYNDTIANLQKLLEAGAISEETFRRAVEKAAEELARATKVDEPEVRPNSASVFQSPAALERRFGAGMPTGVAQQNPAIKLQKTTEQVMFDGRKRTSLAQQQLAETKALREQLDFETFHLN